MIIVKLRIRTIYRGIMRGIYVKLEKHVKMNKYLSVFISFDWNKHSSTVVFDFAKNFLQIFDYGSQTNFIFQEDFGRIIL